MAEDKESQNRPKYVGIMLDENSTAVIGPTGGLSGFDIGASLRNGSNLHLQQGSTISAKEIGIEGVRSNVVIEGSVRREFAAALEELVGEPVPEELKLQLPRIEAEVREASNEKAAIEKLKTSGVGRWVKAQKANEWLSVLFQILAYFR